MKKAAAGRSCPDAARRKKALPAPAGAGKFRAERPENGFDRYCRVK